MDNVKAESFDLYSDVFKNYMNENTFDAAFIDAVHDEEHVKIDIENCRNAGVSLFVFDDYGGFPGVRSAIDQFIDGLKEDDVKHNVTHVGMSLVID